MVFEFKNIEYDISILIPQRCIELMLKELLSYYPNEFGGVLIGIRDKEKTIVVDFVTPTKFSISRKKFVRDNNYLNEELERIYKMSKGKLEYIGEWHSHPEGNTKFSNDDKITMLKIATDLNVGFNFPFLIIFSLNKKTYDYSIYVTVKRLNFKFHNFPCQNWPFEYFYPVSKTTPSIFSKSLYCIFSSFLSTPLQCVIFNTSINLI
jgi:integrative and conjugative element protein (TIGR02256 family)